MTAALEVTALAKRYRGGVEALRGVDVAVAPGELVGLLGPNGAGKSTLVKSAVGLVRPTGGTATVCGAPAGIARGAARPRLPGRAVPLPRLGDGRRGARAAPAPGRFGGRRGRARRAARARRAPRRRGAAHGDDVQGHAAAVGIAQALVGRPQLLLLDEPTSALDPAGRRIVRDLLVELRRRGVAVLLNTHLLSEVEHVCDRVAIIDRGELLAAGSPAELANPQGVEIETATGTRRFAGATRDEVPELVARLVGEGERVYDVRVVRSSLEDAYLAAVERNA